MYELENRRKNKKNVREASEITQEAIIITDTTGKIIFWDGKAKKLFGYSKREIIGKSMDILLLKKHGEKYMKNIEECRYGGEDREVTGVRKNGDKFPLEVSFSCWRKGENIYVINIVKDITEKKKLTEELREERELFIEGPVVVFKWKAGEKCIPVEYVSPNIKKIFGYDQ